MKIPGNQLHRFQAHKHLTKQEKNKVNQQILKGARKCSECRVETKLKPTRLCMKHLRMYSTVNKK